MLTLEMPPHRLDFCSAFRLPLGARPRAALLRFLQAEALAMKRPQDAVGVHQGGRSHEIEWWGVELGGRKLCPTRQSWPGKETEDLPKLRMFYCKWLSPSHRLRLEFPQIPSLPTILLKADAAMLPLLYRQQLCLLWSLLQPQQPPMPTGSSQVSPLLCPSRSSLSLNSLTPPVSLLVPNH